MSLKDSLKSKKVVVILVVAAIIIAAVLIIPHFMGTEPETGPEVVSKRVKVAIKPETPATPQAKPETKPEVKPAKDAKKPGKEAPASKEAQVKQAPNEQLKPETAAKAVVEKKEAPAKIQKKKVVSNVLNKRWAVNLSSFAANSEAEEFTGKLRKAGYNAYITKTRKDEMDWFRVRVGFYRTDAEAKKAGQLIVEKYKLEVEPWVTRPTRAEIRKFSKK